MPRFSRSVDTRNSKKIIRIYTEGKKTECNYFNSIKDELRLSEIKVHGIGDHTDKLLEYVISEKEKEKEDTEWWVVFDRDSHDHFNSSIEKALAKGVNVAYSNECFELWFILHFEFLQSSIGRENFGTKLTKLLGKKYEKNMDIYSLIRHNETVAIRYAKKLEFEYDKKAVSSFLKRDPSTTVYKLIERLRSLKND